jgi:hypothetical protein
MLNEKTETLVEKKSIQSIDKRENLSRRELIEEYVKPLVPVVLKKDATRAWKAMGKITPEFISGNYGDRVKTINGVDYTYAQYVDLMYKSTPENPAPYPFSINVEKYMPELMDDFRPEIIFGKINRVQHPLVPISLFTGTERYEMFLGAKGASFPFLHYDLLSMHTQITQIYGGKEFILFSPDQTRYLYPKENNPLVSQIDVFKPDYDRFPLFREAKPIRVMIEEGETILFPRGWWHTTQIHGPSISLGRVQVNSENWKPFLNDAYQVWKQRFGARASMMKLYGKLVGPILNFQEMFA